MASTSSTTPSAMDPVDDPIPLRFTFSPYCVRCGRGVKCWRAWCAVGWCPMSRHGADRADAEARARRWEPFHACGWSPYDRPRRGERGPAATAAFESGLLF